MLEEIGGLSAVRSAVIDDCTLAKKVKEAGGRIWLGLTLETLSIRRYGSFSEIGRMISRTAFSQLHHSAFLLTATIFGLTITYLAPPVLTLVGGWPARLPAAAAWLAMTICYLPFVRFYGRSWTWSVALPAVAAFYLGATIASAISYWRGRGGRWKGRVQDQVTRTGSG
jgi:hypothetical protein